MKNSYIINLLILLFLSVSINAQENYKINGIVKNYGEKFIKNKNINSVSIGVYKDGGMFSGHFGELEKGKNNTPNDSTIYEIGSVSKTLTGYLVAKAILEKKLNLNDDIRTYLKGDFSNLEYKEKPITIQHLVTHTSGLPTFFPEKLNKVFEKLNKDIPSIYNKTEKEFTKQDFFIELQNYKLKAEPGLSYSYSNAGTDLIGYILEIVYEKNIDELLQETFGKNFGMSSLSIGLNNENKEKIARGYWMNNKTFSPLHLNTTWGSGGGMKMNMKDMLSYMALQLDEENEIVKASHTPLFTIKKPKEIAYYWQTWTDKYGTSYNHHGGTMGTQNWVFIYPKYNLGISIITNQSDDKTPRLLSKTAEKILKELIK